MDNYKQMLAFIWAYEHGNFSAAARVHDLTPSAMSKMISRLENRLKVRLIQRGTRKLVLTEEGQLYLESAKKVVKAMAEADSLAEHFPEKISGLLRVKTMPTFARHQILPWLPEFIECFPNLHVDIKIESRYEDEFEKGIDLAIYGGTLPDSSRVTSRLGTSEWITCASPSYLERFGTPKQPNDLLQHKCFHFNYLNDWNLWEYEKDNEKFSLPIKPLASFSQGDFLRDLALDGQGIVRLADYNVAKDIQLGKLVPLLSTYRLKEPEPIYLIYPNRKFLSPRIKSFMSFFTEKIKKNPWTIKK
ncbi:LysR family transcriptional regulator [Acinetobacter sp. ANC 4470]|uniref:LysR family transcriptional regulator n=1 Tax=Acinetobacter sp. ANC 4470 TaxID=1977881 RepID=UPI000A341CF4|nr:LysR family transcriptional regulator [Acinetobacter sp. ANC 4470]OTG67784.1 LysR family transcriptional regulator [Acinetobacter sp. ANC 4470]